MVMSCIVEGKTSTVGEKMLFVLSVMIFLCKDKTAEAIPGHEMNNIFPSQLASYLALANMLI